MPWIGTTGKMDADPFVVGANLRNCSWLGSKIPRRELAGTIIFTKANQDGVGLPSSIQINFSSTSRLTGVNVRTKYGNSPAEVMGPYWARTKYGNSPAN